MAVVSDEASEKLTLRFGLQAVVDGACASHRRAAGLLVLACLLAFLPGFFGIPPVDRDESRYKKPVGIYWLQAATVALGNAVGVPRAHTRIWLYRFPSLLGAIGAVLATYWAALAFVTRRGALLAGLMMASSILLGFEARLATTDAVLLLTIVAAMGALGRIYLEGQ